MDLVINAKNSSNWHYVSFYQDVGLFYWCNSDDEWMEQHQDTFLALLLDKDSKFMSYNYVFYVMHKKCMLMLTGEQDLDQLVTTGPAVMPQWQCFLHQDVPLIKNKTKTKNTTDTNKSLN